MGCSHVWLIMICSHIWEIKYYMLQFEKHKEVCLMLFFIIHVYTLIQTHQNTRDWNRNPVIIEGLTDISLTWDIGKSADPDQTPHNAASDQGLHC